MFSKLSASAFSLAQTHIVVQEQRQGSLGLQSGKSKADQDLLYAVKSS